MRGKVEKMSDAPANPLKTRCPICKAATAYDMRPFCSKRCKDIDLARWLGDGYGIAGSNDDAGDDSDEPGGRGYRPKG